MNKLVLASGNAGKLKELSEVLNPLGFELIPQGEFNLDSADETGLSFIENALLKARYAAEESGLGALADDSGLCVDCLGGAPGIYSARFGDGTDQGNLEALLATLAQHGEGPWPAHYHCTLVLVKHAEDPDPIIAQGRWLLNTPRILTPSSPKAAGRVRLSPHPKGMAALAMTRFFIAASLRSQPPSYLKTKRIVSAIAVSQPRPCTINCKAHCDHTLRHRFIHSFSVVRAQVPLLRL